MLATATAETLLLFSGGIDSTACARFLTESGHKVKALFVDYGQPAAANEHKATRQLAPMLNVSIESICMSSSACFGKGEIVGRNAFLVFAGLLTQQLRRGAIAIGIHAGTDYYDCTSAFFSCTDRLLEEYTDGQVRLLAPFLTWGKREVLDYAKLSRLPLEMTYSCESGGMPPCGACLSCRDRRLLGC